MNSGRVRFLLAAVVFAVTVALTVAGSAKSQSQSQSQNPQLQGQVQQSANPATTLAGQVSYDQGICSQSTPGTSYGGSEPCIALALQIEGVNKDQTCIPLITAALAAEIAQQTFANSRQPSSPATVQRWKQLQAATEQAVLALERRGCLNPAPGAPHPPSNTLEKPLACQAYWNSWYVGAVGHCQASGASRACFDQASATAKAGLAQCSGQPVPRPPEPPGPQPLPLQPQPGVPYACRACYPQSCVTNGEIISCIDQPTPEPLPCSSQAPGTDTSQASGFELCGPMVNATSTSPGGVGVDLQEYVSVAVALTAEERVALNKRGIVATPQGSHPWCAVASVTTVMNSWHSKTNTKSLNISSLVQQINGYLSKTSGTNPIPEHGYSMAQIADLLELNDMATDVSDFTGNDPVSNLASATTLGPTIVGLTLNYSVPTSTGPWGLIPSTATKSELHAVVVTGVTGKAPNLTITVVDSMLRPTSTTYSYYYKETESEFLKAWQANTADAKGNAKVAREILQTHPWKCH